MTEFTVTIDSADIERVRPDKLDDLIAHKIAAFMQANDIRSCREVRREPQPDGGLVVHVETVDE